jgi:hypothetical protein
MVNTFPLSPQYLTIGASRWADEIKEVVDRDPEECREYFLAPIDNYLHELKMRPNIDYTISDIKRLEYGYNEEMLPTSQSDCHFSFLYVVSVPEGGINRYGKIHLKSPASQSKIFLEAYLEYYSDTPHNLITIPLEGNYYIFPEEIEYWMTPNLANDESVVLLSAKISITPKELQESRND